MDLRNKHIVVVGLGKSGISMVRFLVSRGCSVSVSDNRSEADLRDVLTEIRDLDVKIEIGRHSAELFEKADLIVLSPGVPHTIDPVKRAAEKKIPVIGEIELAYHFIDVPIIAITGTNGKSTTTLLVNEMLKQCGFKTLLGGNIGTPLITYADNDEPADFMVAEISSFQLDTIEAFKPKVSILLNITDDHLDRYPDFDAYARSKARVFENQDASDICILNENDPEILKIAGELKARRFLYNAKQPADNRAWVSGKEIWFQIPETGVQTIDCSNIPMVGTHNLENASAAGLAVLALGGSIHGVKAALDSFKGLSHRVEYVDTVNNVAYYDDSKATNVDAVVRALESFSSPVILIMGGRDKGGSYKSLEPRLKQQVKRMILIGEAAEKIHREIGGLVPTETALTMAQAVGIAHRSAKSGDTVLLSPACSSFDMYDSYAHRGDDFKQAVNQLKRQ